MRQDINRNITIRAWSMNKQRVALFFLILFPLVFLCAAGAEALTAAKVEVKGLYSIDRNEFLDMFGVREGSPVDKDIIRDGIKRAFLKGIFEDVSAEVSDGPDSAVSINVRERDFIRKIYLKGNYRIPKDSIKKMFMLTEDNVMRYDLIEAAAVDLKKKIELYGYPEAVVSIETAKAKKPYRVDVYLKVDTGAPLIIKKLTIKGDDSSTRKRMKLSEGDVYDQHKLKEDLRHLKEYYKGQMYYNPEIGPYKYMDGELDININPGKLLKVVIEGNSKISTNTLRKEASFFEIESFNDEVVEEAVSKILLQYHKEGYAFAQIAPVIKSDEKNIEITFFIFEGEKMKLKSVRFTGNTLPVNKLKDVVSLKEGEVFNPDFIAKDRESLKEFYTALGYLEVNIKETDSEINRTLGTANITINIEEGLKTIISSLDISGVDAETRKVLMTAMVIKTGGPYNEVDISNERFRVLEYFRDNGYADIDVSVETVINNHLAAVNFRVNEGKKWILGRTIVAGNKDTKYRVIKRELQHAEDQPYNQHVISEERQRLYKLGLFTEVEMNAIQGENGKKDMLVSLKEGNAGAVEFGLGYAEYEKERGFFEVNYKNLWGMNRQIMFRTELSSLQRRFILQYQEPWFWGNKLPFRIFFLEENKKALNIITKTTMYDIERYTLTAGVEKNLTEKLKADLYYEYSIVTTSNVQKDVVLSREDTGTLAISSIKPSLIYDTRDNPFDPRKGFVAGLSMKIASSLLFSQTNFNKLEVYSSIFFPLSKRVVLALSARGGMAYGLGSTQELPIVERFFLGGGSTVRGYEQDTLGPKGIDGNPTGGNSFFLGNIEFRTSIGKGFGIVPFFDMGNVWVNANNTDPTDLKYTAGIGLRYSTPVGPIRVDYGFKLNRDTVCVSKDTHHIPHLPAIQHCTPESPGALHFSIGHAF